MTLLLVEPTAIQIAANIATALGVVFAAIQFRHNSQLKATETLLKIEEEFRCVSGTFAEFEDEELYKKIDHILRKALDKGQLTDDEHKKLVQVDRALRFLYLCSVINESLGTDRLPFEEHGVVPLAYYYYIGILIPDDFPRDNLVEYVKTYYRRLDKWVTNHSALLKTFRPASPRIRSAQAPIVISAQPAAAGPSPP